MKEIISFYLNGKEYGIEISGMQSLEKYQEIRPLPDAPDYILGTVNIRDEIFPVFDISSKFGVQGAPQTAFSQGADGKSGEDSERRKILLLRTKAGTLACVVGGVGKVFRAEGGDVQSFPIMAMTKETDFVDFIARRENQLIVVIQPRALLTDEQVEKIKKLELEEKKEKQEEKNEDQERTDTL